MMHSCKIILFSLFKSYKINIVNDESRFSVKFLIYLKLMIWNPHNQSEMELREDLRNALFYPPFFINAS